MPLETCYIDGTISSLQLTRIVRPRLERACSACALCSLSPTTRPAGGLFDWIRWGRATRVSRCSSHCGECTRPPHGASHAAGSSAVPTAHSSTVSHQVTPHTFLLSTASKRALGPSKPPIPRLKWLELQLTTHIHLMQKLRMHGVKPP